MKHDSAFPEPLRARGARTSLLVLAILCAAPTSALGENHEPASFVPEFNRICADLARTRADLGSGLLEEEDFAERILALFVDADSLQVALRTAWPGPRKAGTPLFAMERGLRYLVDSLRENYVGIVARNGFSFVEADRALQAALAWRSGAAPGGVGTMGAGISGVGGFSETVADAARP
jgi:hypothetical protein